MNATHERHSGRKRERRLSPGIAALSLSLALSLLTPSGAEGNPGERATYKIVAHHSVASKLIPRLALEQLFLRQIRRWPNGMTARPVDLPASSPVRAAFAREVMKRTISALRRYWNKQIFSGHVVPPPEFPTEAEVLDYVAATKGSVGYVSADAALPAGTKALEVRF